MAAKNKSNEIHITRIYDAPVKAVWDAWTDSKQVAKWWGPRGFTITTHSKDLRVGGSWSYTMHGPDGTNYENITKYHEVEVGKRLVYDHGGNEDQNRPPLFRVTVEFKDVKGKTKMDMRMTLPTPEAAAETKKFIKQANGNSTWDRLAEYLEEEKTGEDVFVINRSFAAPIDVVFDAWTKPELLAQWMGPKGVDMKFLKADIRPGGHSMYSMGNADFTMYGQAQYLTIERPTLLRYTQQFCDENGKISRHPYAPTWPESMLTTVTFAEEGENETRVTVRWEVDGEASREERQTFHKEKAGMTQGWTGSFDKLEEFLESAED